MSTAIPEVSNVSISHALFIDITLSNNSNSTTYYISSAYKPVEIEGNTYTELGAFLQVGSITDDLKITNGDLQISLTGIPSEVNYVSVMLNNPVKGGNVVVRRGFFDINTMQLIPGAIYERYRGIITNFAIEEDVSFLSGELVTTIAVSCASINTLLENKIAGQRTHKTDRQRFYPGDISFNRVVALQSTAFDFGKKFTGGTGFGGAGGLGGGYFGQQRDFLLS